MKSEGCSQPTSFLDTYNTPHEMYVWRFCLGFFLEALRLAEEVLFHKVNV